MHNAFTGGLVQNGSGPEQSGFGRVGILLLDGGAHIFNDVFNSGARGAVAGSVFKALLVPFDGGFMVSQNKFLRKRVAVFVITKIFFSVYAHLSRKTP